MAGNAKPFYVLFSKDVSKQRYFLHSAVFLFGWAFICIVLIWLFISLYLILESLLQVGMFKVVGSL